MADRRDFTSRLGTLLGPLTTAWSMPSSCNVAVLPCATCNNAFFGQQCVVVNGTGMPSDNTGCWPPATSKVSSPGAPFTGWGFYSPGLVCPTGYTSACTAVYGARPDWEIEYNLFPGETAIGCCPTGYQCTNFNGNTCFATASTGPPVITAPTGMCSGSQLANVNQATFPDVITVTTTPSATDTAAPVGVVQVITRSMLLLAPMFQLNHQPSDLSTTTSTTGTATTSGASSSSSTISSTESSAATTGSPSTAAAASGQSSGLSTGAVAGVAIGAALGGILLAAIVGLIWVKKRRQRAEFDAVALASIDRSPWDKSGTPAPAYPGWGPPARYEMGHPPTRYEMDGSHAHTPIEMPSSTNGGWSQSPGAQYK